MGTAVFYHLIRAGLEDTLRMILTRAVAQGWRVFLRGTDAAALARLDEKLWLGSTTPDTRRPDAKDRES